MWALAGYEADESGQEAEARCDVLRCVINRLSAPPFQVAEELAHTLESAVCPEVHGHCRPRPRPGQRRLPRGARLRTDDITCLT